MAATHISSIRQIGLTLGLALSMSTVATSPSLAYSAKARQMCTGDAFRLCSSEIPNIARIIACMRRNKANLSQGCRAVMDQEDHPATKMKPVQTAPAEQKPATASPVEQPVASETKPVQAAPVEQKPTTATAVEVKPVEAKSASRGKPAKLAQRKQKHHQLTVGRHIHREFGNIERTIGFALPIPLIILFYW